MTELLETSLQTGNIAVCVKDSSKKVLMQNDQCRSICGDSVGETCERGCMELYASDTLQQWPDWGSRVYRNSYMHGGFFDVTLLCSNDNIVTFLQPLSEKYEMALDYYRDKGLTRRETEVIALTIQGASNQDICEALSISRATLRTHLNNVYHKLRDRGDDPRFMPPARISA
ncbi:MAG: helix-turn-helix transcriptional regulator [Thiogranum sp.]|nr:helix-turn-helix transcriptional regulator [Thiogranum sp.]